MLKGMHWSVEVESGLPTETVGGEDSWVESVTERVCKGAVCNRGIWETFATTGSRKETVGETFVSTETAGEAGGLPRGSSILLRPYDGWWATVTGESRPEGALSVGAANLLGVLDSAAVSDGDATGAGVAVRLALPFYHDCG